MALTMSRVDRIPRTYSLASLLGGASSVPAGATGVSVALLAPGSKPTGAVVWTSATYASGSFSLLLAGPDADSTGAFVVPANADLWMKVTDAPLVEAVKVERISVAGGPNLVALPGPGVVSVNGKTGTVVLSASDVGAATPTDLSTGLATKVNSSTYTAGLALKQDAATLAATVGLDTSGRVMAQKIRRYSGLPCQPVASTGGVGHSTGGGTAGGLFTSREPYKMAVACADLQLVYPAGWVISSGGAVGEIATSVTLPGLKASVELPDGSIHPVFFRGTRSVTVDPWAQVVSDPIGVELAAGDVIYIRTFVNATTGTQYTMGTASYGPGITTTGTIGFSNALDEADSGTTFTSDLTKNYWSPIVCGQPLGNPTPTVAFIGDSITVGQGSTNNSFGWWKYGLNNTLPAFAYARSGVLAQGIAAAHKRGFPLMQGLTHGVVMLGANDAGRTFAQIQADLLTIWTALAGRGLKVYAATITPTTTTTDAWATLANQTVKSGEAVRVQINDWIRTTPAPLTGYVDTADATESARNSGKWKVTGAANYATADGLHPSDVLHQAMGAAMPTLTI